MESPYSKAFDHLARPDSIGKQGAHNVQQVGGVLFFTLVFFLFLTDSFGLVRSGTNMHQELLHLLDICLKFRFNLTSNNKSCSLQGMVAK